ncbi:MAG: hypothetical protein AB7O52_06695 [Planctomycetota bacterium]
MAKEKPISILIVVADAIVRDQVFDNLALAGYRVDAVFDRDYALRRLHRDPYAAVVAQAGILMPGDTGLPVVELPATATAAPESLVRDVAAVVQRQTPGARASRADSHPGAFERPPRDHG